MGPKRGGPSASGCHHGDSGEYKPTTQSTDLLSVSFFCGLKRQWVWLLLKLNILYQLALSVLLQPSSTPPSIPHPSLLVNLNSLTTLPSLPPLVPRCLSFLPPSPSSDITLSLFPSPLFSLLSLFFHPPSPLFPSGPMAAYGPFFRLSAQHKHSSTFFFPLDICWKYWEKTGLGEMGY